MRIYLEGKSIWNEDKEKGAWDEARNFVDTEVDKASSQPEPKIEDVFRHTYRDMPQELGRQLVKFKNELKLGEGAR